VRRAAAVLSALVIVLLVMPVSTPAMAAPPGAPRPIKIVQIGDSYSAGNGAGDYYGPRGCYRSRSNWAERYVRHLNAHGYAVTFINRACSGAVSANLTSRRLMETKQVTVLVPRGIPGGSEQVRDLLKEQCSYLYVRYPDEESIEVGDWTITFDPTTNLTRATAPCARFLSAQIEAIGKDTDLVLFTIGGNDVNFADIVKRCFALGLRNPGDCRDRVETAVRTMPRVGEDLAALLTDLHTNRMRPDARLAMLTYPYLSNRPSWVLRSIRAIAGFGGDSYDAGREVRALGDAGDRMQRSIVNRVNAAAGQQFVRLVDTVKEHFAGHEPDPSAARRNPDRWIHEFDSLMPAEWYHPNPRGHEEEKNLLLPHGDFGAIPGDPRDPTIDMVFVVDTTSSMQTALDRVKQRANQIVEEVAVHTSNLRVALVTYRDDPRRTGIATDYPSRVDLPFTADLDAVRDAFAAMQAEGGGDPEETVYSGLEAALSLPWRPGVRKIIVHIGNGPPQEPESRSGLTAQRIIQHALDVDPVAVNPVDVSGSGALGANMIRIADRTGGTFYSSGFGDPGEAVVNAVSGILAEPVAVAGGPYVAKIGDPVNLDASGSFDPDGTITKYEWDFEDDGTFDTSTSGPFLTHAFDSVTSAVIDHLGLRVTDNEGHTSTGSARLDITFDGDEIPEDVDNCPHDANPGQDDSDGDLIGDVCDPDPILPPEDQPGVFPADEPGAVARSNLTGSVFVDTDGDGRRDPGEPGVPGVRINVTGTDAGGVTVARSTVTDADGNWAVTGLIPGRYTIEEVQPAGVEDGADSLGTVRSAAEGASAGTLGADVVTGIVLSGIGSEVVSYGFGEKTQVSPTATATATATPTATATVTPTATPTVTVAPSATPAPGPTTHPPSGLPRTGDNLVSVAVAGVGLTIAGVCLVVFAKRRRRS
jgi:LPXTG-motif cell wall-anchored protein